MLCVAKSHVNGAVFFSIHQRYSVFHAELPPQQLRSSLTTPPSTMAKAVLVVGALSLFATAYAFVPTCSRVAVPLTPTSCSGASSIALALGSSPSVHRVGARTATRTVRTERFSTPTASDGQVSPPVLPAVVPAEKEVEASAGMLKVTAYFGLWYIFNIGYNIYNKRLLNVLPMPWMVASAQLGIGLLYVLPLWVTKIRKAPKLAKGALGPLRSDEYNAAAVAAAVFVLMTVALPDRVLGYSSRSTARRFLSVGRVAPEAK